MMEFERGLEDVVDLEFLFDLDEFQVAFCRNCEAKKNVGQVTEYCPALEPGGQGCARMDLYEMIWWELVHAKNAIVDAMQVWGCEC